MKAKKMVKLVIPDGTEQLNGTPIVKGESGSKEALIIALADIIEASCVQMVQSVKKKKAA